MSATSPAPGPQPTAVPSGLSATVPANALGLAELIHQEHDGRLAFVPGRGFYVFTGTHWQHDPENHDVDGLIQRFFDEKRVAAKNTPGLLDINMQRKILDWGDKVPTPVRHYLQDKCRRDFEDFDAKPDVLNVKNGTLNLRSGQLAKHDPKDFLTHCLDVEWDEKADCPLFLTAIQTAAEFDQDLVAYRLKAYGYALTGYTKEHAVFIKTGGGRNGKSVELETIERLLGPLAGRLSIDALTTKGKRESEQYMEPFSRFRMVIASENERGDELRGAFVKALTNGRGPVRLLFKNTEMATFIGKLFIETNHEFKLGAADDGILERMHLDRYTNYIAQEKRDTELKQKIWDKELSGVLTLLVKQGCQPWFAVGLQPIPASVRNTMTAYRAEQDFVGGWFDTALAVVQGATRMHGYFTKGKALLDDYNAWAERTGSAPFEKSEQLNAAILARLNSRPDVRQCGVEKDRRGGLVGWWNLLLREELPEELQKPNAPGTTVVDGVLFVPVATLVTKPKSGQSGRPSPASTPFTF